ncbi:MAG: PAS domain S-box protein [Ignavibacteriaceae bacterium]|nr:PAS domain S-box protein [Ignavibacteriaceae bacterium]
MNPENIYKNSAILEFLPIGVLQFDPEFKVTFINSNFVRFGVINEEYLDEGNNLSLLHTDLFSGKSIKKELNLIKAGKSFERVLNRMRTKNGVNISLVVKGVPLYDEDVFNGGLLVLEDIKVAEENKLTVDLNDSGKLTELIDGISDLVFITNEDGLLFYLGGKQAGILNPVDEKIAGKSVFELFSSDASLVLSETFPKVLKNRFPENIELHTKIDNELRYFNGTVSSSDSGKGKYLFTALVDLTSHNESLISLKTQIQELEKYADISNEINDAIIGIDFHGDIKFWNKGAEAFFGFHRSEIHGKFIERVISSIDKLHWKSIIKEVKEQGAKVLKISFTHKNGTSIIASLNMRRVDTEEENQIVILCKDITELELRNRKIEESNYRLSLIFNNSSDIICNFNDNGAILDYNPSFLESFGFTPEQIENLNIIDLIHPLSREKHGLSIEKLTANGTQRYELFLNGNKGEALVADARFVEIPSKVSDETLHTAIFKDISLQKKATQDLLLMQSIFDTSSDGICVVNNGKISFANDSFVSIFSYSSQIEIVDKPLSELLEIGSIEKSSKRKSSAREKAVQEVKGFKKNGEIFDAEVSASDFSVNDSVFIVYIVRDISESNRAKKLLEDSEEKYRSLAENLEDFFWISERINEVMKPIFISQAAKRITGYNPKDFLKNPLLMFTLVHPDDLSNYFLGLKKFFKNKYKSTASFEYRILHKSGGVVWIRNKLSVNRNEEKIIKIYGLVSDITVQKRAEEEIKLSAENLQKLNETKDRFISIISHDMRTPFSSILGFTDLLMSDDDLDKSDVRQYVGFIQDSTKMMLGLVNSLLDWTRLQTGRIRFEPVKYDIKIVAQKSISAVSGAALQKNIEVINTIPKDLTVLIDENLMLQVFNNLLSNALKFTPAGGRVTVSASPVITGRFIEINVSDNGVGISEKDIPKVFNVDLKFTTAGTAGEKGTGLGLSLVKEIIEKHGGSIWLESKLNQGTTFKFTLPFASAHFLLVDDSSTDLILYSKLIKNVLDDYGIETAKSVQEAVEKIQKNPPAICITDHQLGTMTGFDLLNIVNSMPAKYKTPFIVLSGDIGTSEILAYNDLGVEYIFKKPVNLANFKEGIEKTLSKLPGKGLG